MEIIRKIVKVGNGAGVILPREWRGGEAKVELLRKPIDIERDIFGLLKDYLPRLVGVYLFGSHARGEGDEFSDVDVLAVSSEESKKIVDGKYNILIVPLKKLKELIKQEVLPFYSMIQEAKPLINQEVLSELKEIDYSKKVVEKSVAHIESALEVIEGFVEGEDLVSGSIIYTLIFRMRCVYILKKILAGKKYDNKGFIKVLEGGGAGEFYKIYRAEKAGRVSKSVAAEEAEKALALARKLLEEVKCLIRKK